MRRRYPGVKRTRPTHVQFDVYDPLDDLWMMRCTTPYNPVDAARGRYSWRVRFYCRLMKSVGRWDGHPMGVRTPITRVTLHWPRAAGQTIGARR